MHEELKNIEKILKDAGVFHGGASLALDHISHLLDEHPGLALHPLQPFWNNEGTVLLCWPETRVTDRHLATMHADRDNNCTYDKWSSGDSSDRWVYELQCSNFGIESSLYCPSNGEVMLSYSITANYERFYQDRRTGTSVMMHQKNRLAICTPTQKISDEMLINQHPLVLAFPFKRNRD